MNKEIKQNNPEESESGGQAAEIWAQEDYHFYGQRANERVMLVRNQHIIILAPVFIISAATLLIPYLLWRFHAPWYLLVMYAAAVAYYLAYHLYGYKHGVNILTNERILNIQQKGFFNCKIVEAELDRIQDVSSDIAGVLQTAFGFGDVVIRTASESVLVLKNVPTPYDVQQAIVRALKEVK